MIGTPGGKIYTLFRAKLKAKYEEFPGNLRSVKSFHEISGRLKSPRSRYNFEFFKRSNLALYNSTDSSNNVSGDRYTTPYLTYSDLSHLISTNTHSLLPVINDLTNLLGIVFLTAIKTPPFLLTDPVCKCG